MVAIGSRLADALGATVGSDISLISPQGQTTPFGTVPRIASRAGEVADDVAGDAGMSPSWAGLTVEPRVNASR